jgi:hypothetical protein
MVLVSHWDNGWDVFILDPMSGLVGTVRAATLAEVESAANGELSRHFHVPLRRFALTIVRQ